jgi:translation initiation factor IF-3
LVDDEGRKEEVKVTEALDIAKQAGLDLVEISPNANPVVCKMMDYRKFIYSQKKRQTEAKKKQSKTSLKEVKFRPTTGEGDFQVKLRNILRFLEEGNKVKISIRFRGREVVHHRIGQELMDRVEKAVTELATVEQRAKLEGRQMVMVVAPIKK